MKRREWDEYMRGYARFVASIPRWPRVDVPSWVPAEARSYLLWQERMLRIKQPGDREPPKKLLILQRLATAPKMRYVWRELERLAASDDALWTFISLAHNRALTPGIVLSIKQRDEGAKQFANVARACRDMMDRDDHAQNDRKLAAALVLVANHFESWAHWASQFESPRLVKKRTKADENRTYVRDLGELTQREFGHTLYGTVATVASIALDRKINSRQVRNWCAESEVTTPASSRRTK
jgi:hypothetical protein